MPLFGRKKSPRLDELTCENFRDEGVRLKGKLVRVDLLPPEGLIEKPDLTPQDREMVVALCVESMVVAKKLQKTKKKKKTKVYMQVSMDNGIRITKRSKGKELAVYAPTNIYLAIPDPHSHRYCAFVVCGDLNVEVIVFKTNKKTRAEDLCATMNRLFEELGHLLRDRTRRSQLARDAADSLRVRMLRKTQRNPENSPESIEQMNLPKSADLCENSSEDAEQKTPRENGVFLEKLPKKTEVQEELEENTEVKKEVEENTEVKKEVEENTEVKKDVEENTEVKKEVEENTEVKKEVEENTEVKKEVEENTEVKKEVEENTEVKKEVEKNTEVKKEVEENTEVKKEVEENAEIKKEVEENAEVKEEVEEDTEVKEAVKEETDF